MLPAKRLVEVVQQNFEDTDCCAIVAYWYQVTNDRQNYADEIRKEAGDVPIVPLVLRGGFDNPNRVMADLRDLIVANRTSFEPPHFPSPLNSLPVVVLLLSRAPFSIESISSPTILPSGSQLSKVSSYM